MMLSDAISVCIEGVCVKLKPDWVKFSHIGMQLLTCSQAEQEKHNDESLPLPLALQSFFETIGELAVFLKRRATIFLKIAEGMCSGPERMTLTDDGLTLALRTQPSTVHLNVIGTWCISGARSLTFVMLQWQAQSPLATTKSLRWSHHKCKVNLHRNMSRFDSDPPAPLVESSPTASQTRVAEALATFETLELSVSECVSRYFNT